MDLLYGSIIPRAKIDIERLGEIVNKAIGLGLGTVYQGIETMEPLIQFYVDGYFLTIENAEDLADGFLITVEEGGVPVILWKEYLKDKYDETSENVKTKGEKVKEYLSRNWEKIIDKIANMIKNFKNKTNNETDSRDKMMKNGNRQIYNQQVNTNLTGGGKNTTIKSIKEHPLNNIINMLSEHKKKLKEIIKQREEVMKKKTTKKKTTKKKTTKKKTMKKKTMKK